MELLDIWIPCDSAWQMSYLRYAPCSCSELEIPVFFLFSTLLPLHSVKVQFDLVESTIGIGLTISRSILFDLFVTLYLMNAQNGISYLRAA